MNNLVSPPQNTAPRANPKLEAHLKYKRKPGQVETESEKNQRLQAEFLALPKEQQDMVLLLMRSADIEKAKRARQPAQPAQLANMPQGAEGNAYAFNPLANNIYDATAPEQVYANKPHGSGIYDATPPDHVSGYANNPHLSPYDKIIPENNK